MVRYVFHCDVIDLDEALVVRWLETVAGGYDCRLGELTYIFCRDAEMREVNIQYLGHDYDTDVITFDYSRGSRLSGDIYVSVERVSEDASMWDDYAVGGVLRELYRVMVHGLLHLTGQDDGSDEERGEMRKKEDAALHVLEKIMGESY